MKMLVSSWALLAILAGGWDSTCAAGEPIGQRAPLEKIRIAPDGRTFQTQSGVPFVPMGVNYYRPGMGWAPQLWKKFDAEATREDFARMKELGVNCVRVFLTFGSFLMEVDATDEEGFAKFDKFLQIAEDTGIYVHPTGPDHWEGLPAWARADRYADEQVLIALENFWKRFAGRYRGRNALFAYDLLNEPHVPWDTPAVRGNWNQWIADRYGSPSKLAKAWKVTPDSISWGEVPPPESTEASDGQRLLDYQHYRGDC